MLPLFLDLVLVLRTHLSLIERYGGEPGVRDIGLLHSAIAMLQASFGGARQSDSEVPCRCGISGTGQEREKRKGPVVSAKGCGNGSVQVLLAPDGGGADQVDSVCATGSSRLRGLRTKRGA